MSDFTIHYRGLLRAKEIPTQNNVTLAVRNEEQWEAANEDHKPVHFIAVKGTGQRAGVAVAVDWKLPVTTELPGLIDAFVNHVDVSQRSRQVLRNFQELTLTCEPMPGLTLGWVFSEHGAHGYAAFQQGDTSITATFAHSDAFAMLRNALG